MVFERLAKLAVRAAIRVLAFVGAAFVAPMGWSIGLAIHDTWPYAALFIVVGGIYDLVFRIDRKAWRFSSLPEIVVVVQGSAITVCFLLLAAFVFDRGSGLPRSMIALVWAADVGLFAGLLLTRRALYERIFWPALTPFIPAAYGKGEPVLLLGEMASADAFMRDIARTQDATYRPIGLVSDNSADIGRELRGIRVMASINAIGDVLENFAARDGRRTILFLDESVAPPDLNADQLGKLRTRNVRLMRLSRMVELNDSAPVLKLREINFEELLARVPVNLDYTEIRELVSGKRVLVTGAGGSIGSELSRQLAALGCAHIGLLDNSEFALFNIDSEIAAGYATLSRSDILCDIRNADRVLDWMQAESPDLVFHAAALKHVPMMENHPCESVLTNVVGTWNVADAARIAGAGHMIAISTDKAVDPSSVMGATKRLAESVIRVHRAAASMTRFSVVRFGNVLGSAGSVVPTFKAQIERGGPVTLTHPDIERYFMTIPEAVQLVLHATAKTAMRNHQSGVFVLDMGKPIKIMALARRLIELHGKVPERDIEIKITGLRPGEKLTEELVDSTEEAQACDPGVVEVTDRVTGARIDRAFVARLETMARTGNSQNTRALLFETLDQVRALPSYLARTIA